MTQPILKWTLMSLLWLALLACAWKTWEQAAAYETQTLAIISQLETEQQIENSGRRLLEALSFGLYDGYSRQLEQLNAQKVLQAAYKASVHQLTGLYLILTGVLLAVVWGFQRNLGDLGAALLGVALIALAVGLSTPILAVAASQDLPVLGETVLQFQSKGILATISSLWQGDHPWLAALLMTFSVILPLLKTAITALTRLSATHPVALKGFQFSRNLGKWSMADVFVVAILIAFFSSNQGGLTAAEAQAGLWFFALYVLASLVGSQLIAHQLPKPSTQP